MKKHKLFSQALDLLESGTPQFSVRPNFSAHCVYKTVFGSKGNGLQPVGATIDDPSCSSSYRKRHRNMRRLINKKPLGGFKIRRGIVISL